MKKVMVRINKDLKDKLKILAVKRNMTLEKIIEEILSNYLKGK